MESASGRHYNKRASSRRTEELSESGSSTGGHWKSKLKRQKSSIEDDLSQPWVCEETDPFTPRICYFDFPKTRMPNHIKTYDGSEDSVDEMMRLTTTFLRGEVAASNRERKKSFPSWKQQEANQKQSFKKGGFQNQQRPERKQDRFTLLTKTPKEIFALDKGKLKAPPPMTTPVEN
ncbi:hypothetical protein Tco_0166559 [Tanacetum coccineum]